MRPIGLIGLWCVLTSLSVVFTGCGRELARTTPLDVGQTLHTDVALEDVERHGRSVEVDALLGGATTVFYAWSVPCPCIANAEARVQALLKEYEDVRMVAVAGEPQDTLEQLREQKLRFGSPYQVLRDPQQELCRLLKMDSAALVTVFDADRTLVYRGPLDEDFVDGKAEFLREVLDALAAGRPVPQSERPRTYGCLFNEPESCGQPR